MLFKKSVGKIEDRRRDAHSVISEGYSCDVKRRFVHYDFKNLDGYVLRYIKYASLEALDYLDFKKGCETSIQTDKNIVKQRKKKFGIYYRAPMLLRAWLWFLYNYVFRLGFLDGREGFVFCFLECYWYRVLVDAKIMEMKKLEKNAAL